MYNLCRSTPATEQIPLSGSTRICQEPNKSGRGQLQNKYKQFMYGYIHWSYNSIILLHNNSDGGYYCCTLIFVLMAGPRNPTTPYNSLNEITKKRVYNYYNTHIKHKSWSEIIYAPQHRVLVFGVGMLYIQSILFLPLH